MGSGWKKLAGTRRRCASASQELRFRVSPGGQYVTGHICDSVLIWAGRPSGIPEVATMS